MADVALGTLFASSTVAAGTVANRGAGWNPTLNRWEQTADLRDSRGNLRDIPPNVRNSNYTFTADDRGRQVIKNNTTAYVWTLPTDATAGWGNADDGPGITIVNDGTSGNVTIQLSGGVTLLDGSTSGSYSLLPNSVRTLLRVGANRWRVA